MQMKHKYLDTPQQKKSAYAFGHADKNEIAYTVYSITEVIHAREIYDLLLS